MKSKKRNLLIFILFLYSSLIFSSINPLINEQDEKGNRNTEPYISASNSHAYEWYRTWGGSDYDYGQGVAVDSSDNVYFAGFTPNFGAGYVDMVLVKYDSAGGIQWSRTWGGNSSEWGYGVAADSSDNVYLAGKTASFGVGGEDMVLVKYDSSGDQQWNLTWGGSARDEGKGVAVDLSGNVYLSGNTYSFGEGWNDMVLVKYNSFGVEQWNRTWGGNNNEFNDDVAVDSSGNIYLAGWTNSFGAGDYDICLVKFNPTGGVVWNYTWGGSGSDKGHGVAVDSSGNIYLAGENEDDMVLVKYNNLGVEQWSRTREDGSGEGVAVDSLGNVYLAGDISVPMRWNDLVLAKYDSSGVEQWNYTWGGSDREWGSGVAVDTVDNLYLAGYTESFGAGSLDLALVKYLKVPEITIISPSQNEVIGSVTPNFTISIIEPNLNNTWYSLDEGITNIIFSGLTGTINQTEWDKEGTGLVSIRFYANDTLGRVGFAEVSVYKDLANPEITIFTPSQDDEFGNQAPHLSIIIVEPNIDSIWYTIDGGVNNYTITPPPEWNPQGSLGETINQEAWDAAPYGILTIRPYVNDTMGNIGYSEIDIEKVKPSQGIPGYTLLLFISTLGVITAITLKKKYKSNLK